MRRVLVVVLAVLVLLVVVDRAAAYLASGAVADAVRREQRLGATPDVDIQGFPFLTQALGGVYREVDVRLDAVPAQRAVGVDEVVVHLRGVHLPVGNAVRGAVTGVPVDAADAQARVSFAALASQLQQADGALRLAVAPGPAPDLLSLTGPVTLDGTPVPVRAQVRLAVAGGALTATLVPSSLAGVPARVRPRAERLLSEVAVRLPSLPFGFRFTSVSVGADGVTVAAAARALVLR